MPVAWRDWIEDLRTGLHGLGLCLSWERVSQCCEDFFGGVCAPREGLTVYETRIRNLALSLGAQPSDSWCRALATESMVRWQAQIYLDPEALPTLRRLRAQGLRVGVLSNFDHAPHVLHILQETGLAEQLDSVVVSGAVGLKKPDPRIFHLACDRMGCKPEYTVFVGDHVEQDFEGAHNAGLVAILLQRSTAASPGTEKAAHRVVSSLSQILN